MRNSSGVISGLTVEVHAQPIGVPELEANFDEAPIGDDLPRLVVPELLAIVRRIQAAANSGM